MKKTFYIYSLFICLGMVLTACERDNECQPVVYKTMITKMAAYVVDAEGHDMLNPESPTAIKDTDIQINYSFNNSFNKAYAGVEIHLHEKSGLYYMSFMPQIPVEGLVTHYEYYKYQQNKEVFYEKRSNQTVMTRTYLRFKKNQRPLLLETEYRIFKNPYESYYGHESVVLENAWIEGVHFYSKSTDIGTIVLEDK
ncbi:hypothetical protein [Bacteroides coprosuis]|uniref:hypothetical protein n=1 Tax=Bacteroides coprosuis TaxID=151276 RepID=UPI001D463D36|nr:hypothetical protein [Bacteroides coprosuis]HJD91524.1 hypothetical protein [Bacteroides coprosuis]